MNKSTKHCSLNVHLSSGRMLTGEFHVPANTSSTIRPSDAIQDSGRPFILLAKAAIDDADPPRSVGSVLVPHAAIAFIEIASGWS